MNVYENRGQLGSTADRTDRVRYDNTGSRALIREKENTWNIVAKGAEDLEQKRLRARAMRLAAEERERERQERERIQKINDARRVEKHTAAVARKAQAEELAAAKAAKDANERRVAADAMFLNGEYSNRMTELQTKLLTNKGGAARDNVRLLDEGRQKIIDEICANNKDKYDLETINVFRGMSDKDYVKTRGNMVKYATGENEKYENDVRLQQKAGMINDFASAYEDDGALAEAVTRGAAVIGAGLAGLGEARVNQENMEFQSDLLEAGINAAMNDGNFARADDLLQMGRERNVFNEKKFQELNGNIAERSLQAKTFDGTRRLFEETEGNYSVMLDRFRKEVLGTDKAEQVKQLEMFDKEYHSLRSRARDAADANHERTGAGVRALVNGGMDYGQIMAEIDKQAGGDMERKLKMRKELDRQMGRGGAGIDDAGYKNMVALIVKDQFRNAEDLEDFLNNPDECMEILGGVPTKTQIKKLMAEYRDSTQGKGVYAVDWKGIMSRLKTDPVLLENIKAMGGKKVDDEMVLEAVEYVGKEFVQGYKRGEVAGSDGKYHVGEVPSEREIMMVCRNAAARATYEATDKPAELFSPSTWFDGFRNDVEISRADMWRMGIKNITQQKNGMFRVEYADGYPPEELDSGELNDRMKNIWHVGK